MPASTSQTHEVAARRRRPRIHRSGWRLRTAGVGVGDATDSTTAWELAEESLHLARQTGDPDLIAASLHTIGFVDFRTSDPQTGSALEEGLAGDLETAKAIHEEETELTRRTLGIDNIGALGNLGIIAYAQGDNASAPTAGRIARDSPKRSPGLDVPRRCYLDPITERRESTRIRFC